MSFSCSCFFTLLNLQGTRSRLFDCQCATFAHTLFHLSSTFFENTLLLSSTLIQARPPLVEELVYFITLFRVCQELFSSFFEVFNLELLFSSPFSTTSTLSSELVHFITQPSLCQALFSGPTRSRQLPLSSFSLFDLFSVPSSEALRIIPPQPLL